MKRLHSAEMTNWQLNDTRDQDSTDDNEGIILLI